MFYIACRIQFAVDKELIWARLGDHMCLKWFFHYIPDIRTYILKYTRAELQHSHFPRRYLNNIRKQQRDSQRSERRTNIFFCICFEVPFHQSGDNSQSQGICDLIILIKYTQQEAVASAYSRVPTLRDILQLQ